MSGRSVVLVTVAGQAGREDVAVAADVPASQLVQPLAALVAGAGGDLTGSALARLHLRLGARVLPPTRTLAESGVRDGHELVLSAEG